MLNVRLTSRVLVKVVKKESNWVLAARLWRAAQGVDSVGTTHVRVKRIP